MILALSRSPAAPRRAALALAALALAALAKELFRLHKLARSRFYRPEPGFNVAPTQNVLAITNRDPGTVTELRWGLVPFWATDPSTMKLTTFNARIETIATARTYREPVKSKRCAILASGFYEWRRNEDGKKAPMWISRRDNEPFVFAGLWDRWRRGDAALSSCTIVKQPPNELLAPIHSRVPVILHDDVVKEWLSPGARRLILCVPGSWRSQMQYNLRWSSARRERIEDVNTIGIALS